MERTDWLDEGLSPADARFLMLTAITHHKFSSPAWGEHEVRKLHAELAELDQLVTQASGSGFGSGRYPSRCSRAITAAASACVVSACAVRWGGHGWLHHTRYRRHRCTNRSTINAWLSIKPLVGRVGLEPTTGGL